MTNDGTRTSPSPHWWVWALLAGAALYGLQQAIARAWVCDDAFLSFRYAQNLVRGHGLVFNVGERVEGYTNFLWTVWIAAAIRLGLDPVRFSVIAGVGAYVSTAAILAVDSLRARRFLPLAALGLLVHPEAHVWATSGLETAAFGLFILAGHQVLARATGWRPACVASSLLVLAALTRPDGLLLWLAGGVAWAILMRPPFRSLVAYLTPLISVYLPYWVTRFRYYGWPFPNTYYAKSADLANWTQGWRYLRLYVVSYPVLLLVPMVALIGVGLIARRSTKGSAPASFERSWMLATAMVLAYLAYVVRVGGDFMFARFLIPVLPLSLLVLEQGLDALLRPGRLRLAVGFAGVVGCGLAIPPFSQPRQVIDGITDESSWYPADVVARARRQGEALRSVTRDLVLPVAFGGGRAMLVYYAEIPVAIEVTAGLTDEAIAQQPLRQRGRPGHEKPAPLRYLVQRGASVLLNLGRAAPRPVQHIRLGDLDAVLQWYDCEQVEQLRRAGVEVPDVPALLDRLTASESRQELPADRVALYHFFYSFYFLHNDDGPREIAFRRRLGLPPDRLHRLPWMGQARCPPAALAESIAEVPPA